MTDDSHATSSSEAPAHHEEHLRKLYLIYVALIVLLVLTVGASFLHLPGHFNIIVTMSIAVIKAVLVVLVFMHVMHSSKLVWIFSAAAFVWLGILLLLTFSDYWTRHDLTRGTPFPPETPFAHSVTEHHAPQPRG